MGGRGLQATRPLYPRGGAVREVTLMLDPRRDTSSDLTCRSVGRRLAPDRDELLPPPARAGLANASRAVVLARRYPQRTRTSTRSRRRTPRPFAPPLSRGSA